MSVPCMDRRRKIKKCTKAGFNAALFIANRPQKRSRQSHRPRLGTEHQKEGSPGKFQQPATRESKINDDRLGPRDGHPTIHATAIPNPEQYPARLSVQQPNDPPLQNALHLRIDTHHLSPFLKLHRIRPKPPGRMPSSGSFSRLLHTHNLVHLEFSFQEYTQTTTLPNTQTQQHPVPGPMLPNDTKGTVGVTFLSHQRRGTPLYTCRMPRSRPRLAFQLRATNRLACSSYSPPPPMLVQVLGPWSTIPPHLDWRYSWIATPKRVRLHLGQALTSHQPSINKTRLQHHQQTPAVSFRPYYEICSSPFPSPRRKYQLVGVYAYQALCSSRLHLSSHLHNLDIPCSLTVISAPSLSCCVELSYPR